MYQLDFKQPVHIHMIGIGGISMSALAQILLSCGYTISGSDRTLSDLTDRLEQLGAKIYEDHSADNLSSSVQLVVYTAAIHEDNEEYTEAIRRNIPLLTRAQLFGQIMKQYKHTVCVSGTHGKTTATSMLSLIMMHAGVDPTAVVGGIVKEFESALHLGRKDFMIAEACEYTNSFHSFFPTDAIILNIDADHLDFFKNLSEIRSSFHHFASLIPAEGTLVMNGAINDLSSFTEGLSCHVVTYGITDKKLPAVLPEASDADGVSLQAPLDCPYPFTAANLVSSHADYSFDLFCDGIFTAHFTLGTPGRHNVENALAAIAMASRYHIPYADMQAALSDYHGTKRRFEYKGKLGSIAIYDDYAHHPTEIRAALTAAREFSTGRIVVVFQPHTYSRLEALFTDFADALSLADRIILAETYASREFGAKPRITSVDLKLLLEKNGKEVYYFSTFDEIINFLLTNSSPGDLLITMGAGDVVNIGEILLGK